jgi:hypothetical protein
MDAKQITTQTPAGKALTITITITDGPEFAVEVGDLSGIAYAVEMLHGQPVLRVGSSFVAITAETADALDAILDASYAPASPVCKLWTRDEGCPMHGESCHESALRGLDNIDAYGI